MAATSVHVDNAVEVIPTVSAQREEGLAACLRVVHAKVGLARGAPPPVDLTPLQDGEPTGHHHDLTLLQEAKDVVASIPRKSTKQREDEKTKIKKKHMEESRQS